MSSTFPIPTTRWSDRLQQGVLRRITHAINHLIRQEPQAEQRLQSHLGKRLDLHVAGLRAALVISAAGAFEPVHLEALDQPPALKLEIDMPAVLAAQWRGQPLGLTGVRITGDAEFAQAVSWMFSHVRWDAEDDLAQWLGDIPAHRLARVGRGAWVEVRRLRQQLEADAKDWLTEAPRDLVGRAEFTACSAEFTRLRDATARLDKRVQRLSRRPSTARN
jgi:ubiquinone biosynthesis protein UbiJ